LVLSLAWSTKAHATDCEDEAFGGFMLFGSIFLYFLALNKKSNWIAVLGAVFFGLFVTAWDGHRLLSLVMCLAVSLYSVIGIFRNRRSFEIFKYYAIMVVGGNILWRAVLHIGPGLGFAMLMPHGIEIASFTLALAAVVLNEFMLRDFSGSLSILKNKIIVLVLVGIVVGFIVGPTAWYHFYKVGFVDVGQSSVVFKTIAEQHPFAGSVGEYLKKIALVLGPAGLLTVLALLPMLIYSYKKMHFGTLFMFCWACVMLWGLYFRSQYMFVASIPIILGSSFVVILSNKKLSGSYYIVPLILICVVSVLYTPLGKNLIGYDTNAIFYNVASFDRVVWQDALEYFATMPENTAIMTWWDYGHWITAVSRRHVLIDNLQYDHYEIQDVAKFFMLETDEDKAYEIVKGFRDAYNQEPLSGIYDEPVNLGYVAIDWTMIGKSGAMHFIATGDLETQEDAFWNSIYVLLGMRYVVGLIF